LAWSAQEGGDSSVRDAFRCRGRELGDIGVGERDHRNIDVVIGAEVEAWFRELFATLDALHASTDSEILDYRATAHDTMGFSVLEFRQLLAMGEHVATFDCIATIVWKHTPDGWREARWHGSVISAVIPDGMLPT
jgi:hypothetical protein